MLYRKSAKHAKKREIKKEEFFFYKTNFKIKTLRSLRSLREKNKNKSPQRRRVKIS